MTLAPSRFTHGQEGGWDPYSAPATGTDDSRFAQSRSTGGWGSTPNRTTVSTWKALVEELKASTPPLPPARKRIELAKIVRVESEKTYALISRGVVERVPTLVATADGKHKKPKAKAGALLDLVALGDKDGVVRPSVIFEAGLKWAETNEATPTELRVLNDAIAQAILVQHGIGDVPDYELP